MDLTIILSVIILSVLLLLAGLIVFIFISLKKVFLDTDKITKKQFVELDNSIKSSVEPKFLDISPSSNNIIELAIEVWRIEKRLSKSSKDLSDDQNKAFENSTAKLRRFLEKNDITYVDYTDQKYNQGMNLDVLSIEKDASIPESVIKETHEPAVLHKGQLVKKAKVVVLEK